MWSGGEQAELEPASVSSVCPSLCQRCRPDVLLLSQPIPGTVTCGEQDRTILGLEEYRCERAAVESGGGWVCNLKTPIREKK